MLFGFWKFLPWIFLSPSDKLAKYTTDTSAEVKHFFAFDYLYSEETLDSPDVVVGRSHDNPDIRRDKAIILRSPLVTIAVDRTENSRCGPSQTQPSIKQSGVTIWSKLSCQLYYLLHYQQSLVGYALLT